MQFCYGLDLGLSPIIRHGICELPAYAYMGTICLDGLPHTAAFTVFFVLLGAEKRSDA